MPSSFSPAYSQCPTFIFIFIFRFTAACAPQSGGAGGGVVMFAARTMTGSATISANGASGNPSTNFCNWPNGMWAG